MKRTVMKCSVMRSVMVVKPNYRRRYRAAQNMNRAGFPHWFIASTLCIPRQSLESILEGSGLWLGHRDALRNALQIEEMRVLDEVQI